MLEEIKRQLGANYRQSDEQLLLELIQKYTAVALNISNRNSEQGLEMYIADAVISHYIRLGNEGLNSSNEASISYVYVDIQNKMRNDIVKNGMRLIK